MNPESLTVVWMLLGGIALVFVIAGIMMFVLKKRQQAKKLKSLPTGGADTSAFSDMLAEKYRNERLNRKK